VSAPRVALEKASRVRPMVTIVRSADGEAIATAAVPEREYADGS
jgi:hypothetical protein